GYGRRNFQESEASLYERTSELDSDSFEGSDGEGEERASGDHSGNRSEPSRFTERLSIPGSMSVCHRGMQTRGAVASGDRRRRRASSARDSLHSRYLGSMMMKKRIHEKRI